MGKDGQDGQKVLTQYSEGLLKLLKKPTGNAIVKLVLRFQTSQTTSKTTHASVTYLTVFEGC